AQPMTDPVRHPVLRAGFAAAFVILTACGATVRAEDDERGAARGVIYVESNDPAGNAVFAYSRAADGSLTPLPGSPFSAGGLGITPTFDLGPYDSDQNMIVDPSHEYLFAVNGGSDTVAVFQIARDGSLSHVPGSPFPSGGSNPVSVGLADDILCVVNKDQDPQHPGQTLPNYTSFRVNRRGQLNPIPHSTIDVDAGSSPSQALVRPEGRWLFGADFMGGLLRSFRITPAGRLFPTDAQPLPASEFAGTMAPHWPLGLALHPSKPLLYVGLVTINRVAVYRYDERGGLHFLRSVPDSGMAVCWLLTNKEGTRLYTSNTADPSVSVYDISGDPTRPIQMQKVMLHSTGSCFQFALDPTEKFLHVVTQHAAPTQDGSANGLNVLSVGADGRLTEVPSSPTHLPVQGLTRPQGVVAL
ncbi:MAG: lactonase family protein, partial [Planctomycetia bacterium]|nr:lactonase family protein [Planctomycetia bacterium]